MKTNRYHDRGYFFKYGTAEVALSILDNLKVRWSSPLLFNDPFDVERAFELGFDLDELWAPLSEEMEHVFLGDKDPHLVGDTPFTRVLTHFRAKPGSSRVAVTPDDRKQRAAKPMLSPELP